MVEKLTPKLATFYFNNLDVLNTNLRLKQNDTLTRTDDKFLLHS